MLRRYQRIISMGFTPLTSEDFVERITNPSTLFKENAENIAFHRLLAGYENPGLPTWVGPFSVFILSIHISSQIRLFQPYQTTGPSAFGTYCSQAEETDGHLDITNRLLIIQQVFPPPLLIFSFLMFT